jgi:hypothetical protein
MVRPIGNTPGDRIACPKCNRCVPRLDVEDGHGFATCSHKSRRSGGANVLCGQHIFWHCTSRLCAVVGITTEEHASLRGRGLRPNEILAELGLRPFLRAA